MLKIEEYRRNQINDLDNDVLHALANAAIDGFGTKMTIDDAISHITSADILHVFYDGNEPVGFASYLVPKEKLLYLHGVVLKRSHQARGFLSRSAMAAIESTNPSYFAYRTQNPVMGYFALKLAKLTNGIVYPLQEIADEKIEHLVTDISMLIYGRRPNGFVFEGAYGDMLYDKIPRSPDPYVNMLFDEMLEYSRGDSLLIIIDLTNVDGDN